MEFSSLNQLFLAFILLIPIVIISRTVVTGTYTIPFLVHPLVFGMFGKAMKNDGVMPVKPVIVFVIIGLIGSLLSLFVF